VTAMPCLSGRPDRDESKAYNSAQEAESPSIPLYSCSKTMEALNARGRWGQRAGEIVMENKDALIVNRAGQVDLPFDVDQPFLAGIGPGGDAHRKAEAVITEVNDGQTVQPADRFALQGDEDIALGDRFPELKPYFRQKTAIAMTTDDPIALAKQLKDFSQQGKVLEIKAGIIEAHYLSPEMFGEIVKLNSKWI